MQERRLHPPKTKPDRTYDCSPELDLLLACVCWPQRRELDRQRIEAKIGAKMDWSLFLRLARHHRVVPLVSHALQTVRCDAVGPEAKAALKELRELAVASAHDSLRSLAELRRIVKALEARGISSRVLKGLPLAQSVFGDLSLRPSGDIDLLIDQESILETDRVLRELGYSAEPGVGGFSGKRLKFYRAHWKDVVYRNSGSGFEVDVHWRCFRNRAMPGAELCASAEYETIDFGGFRVKTPLRLESLLYLCIHGTLDGWLYLKSLVDVAAQTRTMSEAELDALAALAEKHGVLPELSATLILVGRYLGMSRWSSRLLAANDATVAHILRYADAVLIEGRFLSQRDAIPIGKTIAFELGLRKNFRYRFELLLRVLFRVRMWETFPLPDALFGMYPLLSPLEWLVYRLRQSGEKPASSKM